MDAETVHEVAKGSSFLCHLRANRLEYLLVLMVASSLGVIDSLMAHAPTGCF